MSYYDRLHPWCIIHHLPAMQRVVAARFRRRSDAEAHLKILRQLAPTAHYTLIFDPPDEPIKVGKGNDRNFHQSLLDYSIGFACKQASRSIAIRRSYA